ncbi:MAG: hydroxyisourate hydrolase [bacterium]
MNEVDANANNDADNRSRPIATLSTHILDSVRGGDAVGVRVALHRIGDDGARSLLFEARTDADGRLRQSIALDGDDDARYELVFHVAEYFDKCFDERFADRESPNAPRQSPLRETAVRLAMPDPNGAYHLPMMIAPHSCALWCA